ncbi:MAG TPA: hypothetical protein VEH76_11315 [Methylocystis sp.]|nr:hypothetical protein [Methylocystis sp.]
MTSKLLRRIMALLGIFVFSGCARDKGAAGIDGMSVEALSAHLKNQAPATCPVDPKSFYCKRIDAFMLEHYRSCWSASATPNNKTTYAPRVEFVLSRSGELEGEPRLLNPSVNPVEKELGERALAAVRRCSPVPIPPDFAAHYDYWRVTVLQMNES